MRLLHPIGTWLLLLEPCPLTNRVLRRQPLVTVQPLPLLLTHLLVNQMLLQHSPLANKFFTIATTLAKNRVGLRLQTALNTASAALVVIRYRIAVAGQ